ncbi:MAG: penicillin-binding protein 2 [Lachnospiraceae bacterium]|nr:penicillin-binding protein 2 [Lachnospiraceae bacterium]
MKFSELFTIRDKEHRVERKKENRAIAYITYAFVLIFVVLIVYLLWYTYFRGPEDINNSYNPRQDIYAARVVRGGILSRDGEVLACTEKHENGDEERVYPYGPLFAHAVGFSTHGKTGVELNTNIRLLTSNRPVLERASNALSGKKSAGDNVITTLDLGMQKAAYDALASYKGAIVASDVKTGEILCMVSKPDFDPNTIDTDWERINADTGSGILLNRATQGLYPPGSTFKIITTLEYLKERGEDAYDYHFDCTGSFEYKGSIINCYHGRKHGEMDLISSFAKSCNSSFANISTTVDKGAFRKTCEELLFNKELPVQFSYRESYVPLDASSSTDELLQTAIGQGKTQITPLHMNMITQAIANDGIMMSPYIIGGIVSDDGKPVRKYGAREYGRVASEKNCGELKMLMEEVIKTGTGTRLSDTTGYTAAGKTGSAEYSSNKVMSHAWFTGYAPVDDPKVCVTVIAEEAGSGGEIAVPMARKVFDAYFNGR